MPLNKSQNSYDIPTFETDPQDGLSTTRIEDFQIVFRKSKTGGRDIPMLRFTWVWIVTTKGSKEGIKVPGCLAYRFYHKDTHEPIVVWSPPKNRMGHAWAKMMLVCPDTYNRVLKALLSTKFIEHIGLPAAPRPPEEHLVDMGELGLPTSVSVDEKGNIQNE